MTTIRQGGLEHPAVVALLEEHFTAMLSHSPCGTCHFLDLSALAAPDVTFWTAWDGETPLGCGALRAIAPDHGEIKSMRVTAARMGRGIGHALLSTIIAEARARGHARVSLETGTSPYFVPAQRLYERAGFADCPPFADYAPSAHNRFMTLAL